MTGHYSFGRKSRAGARDSVTDYYGKPREHRNASRFQDNRDYYDDDTAAWDEHRSPSDSEWQQRGHSMGVTRDRMGHTYHPRHDSHRDVGYSHQQQLSHSRDHHRRPRYDNEHSRVHSPSRPERRREERYHASHHLPVTPEFRQQQESGARYETTSHRQFVPGINARSHQVHRSSPRGYSQNEQYHESYDFPLHADSQSGMDSEDASRQLQEILDRDFELMQDGQKSERSITLPYQRASTRQPDIATIPERQATPPPPPTTKVPRKHFFSRRRKALPPGQTVPSSTMGSVISAPAAFAPSPIDEITPRATKAYVQGFGVTHYENEVTKLTIDGSTNLPAAGLPATINTTGPPSITLTTTSTDRSMKEEKHLIQSWEKHDASKKQPLSAPSQSTEKGETRSTEEDNKSKKSLTASVVVIEKPSPIPAEVRPPAANSNLSRSSTPISMKMPSYESDPEIRNLVVDLKAKGYQVHPRIGVFTAASSITTSCSDRYKSNSREEGTAKKEHETKNAGPQRAKVKETVDAPPREGGALFNLIPRSGSSSFFRAKVKRSTKSTSSRNSQSKTSSVSEPDQTAPEDSTCNDSHQPEEPQPILSVLSAQGIRGALGLPVKSGLTERAITSGFEGSEAGEETSSKGGPYYFENQSATTDRQTVVPETIAKPDGASEAISELSFIPKPIGTVGSFSSFQGVNENTTADRVFDQLLLACRLAICPPRS